MYIYGGINTQAGVQNDFQSFDLLTKCWSKVRPENDLIYPGKFNYLGHLYRHSVQLIDNKMIIFGGQISLNI